MIQVNQEAYWITGKQNVMVVEIIMDTLQAQVIYNKRVPQGYVTGFAAMVGLKDLKPIESHDERIERWLERWGKRA